MTIHNEHLLSKLSKFSNSDMVVVITDFPGALRSPAAPQFAFRPQRSLRIAPGSQARVEQVALQRLGFSTALRCIQICCEDEASQ